MKISWGTGIAISYALFVLLLLSVLVFAMGEDVNLVSADYYEQELAYQDKIEKISRTNQLEDTVRIILVDDVLRITFPDVFDPENTSGSIILYRPSDRKNDKTIELQLLKDHIQHISTSDLQTGLWRVKLDWEYEGLEYYIEKNVVVE